MQDHDVSVSYSHTRNGSNPTMPRKPVAREYSLKALHESIGKYKPDWKGGGPLQVSLQCLSFLRRLILVVVFLLHVVAEMLRQEEMAQRDLTLR